MSEDVGVSRETLILEVSDLRKRLAALEADNAELVMSLIEINGYALHSSCSTCREIGTIAESVTDQPHPGAAILAKLDAQANTNIRLRAKAEERRKVIEPLEWLWSDRTQQYYCPHCLKHKMPGHASDCALAKALREE